MDFTAKGRGASGHSSALNAARPTPPSGVGRCCRRRLRRARSASARPRWRGPPPPLLSTPRPVVPHRPGCWFPNGQARGSPWAINSSRARLLSPLSSFFPTVLPHPRFTGGGAPGPPGGGGSSQQCFCTPGPPGQGPPVHRGGEGSPQQRFPTPGPPGEGPPVPRGGKGGKRIAPAGSRPDLVHPLAPAARPPLADALFATNRLTLGRSAPACRQRAVSLWLGPLPTPIPPPPPPLRTPPASAPHTAHALPCNGDAAAMVRALEDGGGARRGRAWRAADWEPAGYPTRSAHARPRARPLPCGGLLPSPGQRGRWLQP